MSSAKQRRGSGRRPRRRYERASSGRDASHKNPAARQSALIHVLFDATDAGAGRPHKAHRDPPQEGKPEDRCGLEITFSLANAGAFQNFAAALWQNQYARRSGVPLGSDQCQIAWPLARCGSDRRSHHADLPGSAIYCLCVSNGAGTLGDKRPYSFCADEPID